MGSRKLIKPLYTGILIKISKEHKKEKVAQVQKLLTQIQELEIRHKKQEKLWKWLGNL